ncbi:MAG: S-layer homology domain-containing protein [Candidatus Peribacteria bacterium]|nr:MAG: S-layer homology domain-containing protein [Candidatus Peribacteria bacterium]
MKKILASMVVCSLTIASTFAMTFETMSEVDSANFLASEGIIADQSANTDLYRLGDTITRKETMKIVMKLHGSEVKDTCEGKFSDVPADWGCKYIEAALNAGLIAGNATFRPDDNITKTEAMKLILKAKGVEKTQETENWQEDYMMTAYEYGIIEEKYYDYNADSKRGWIFQTATSTVKKEVEIKQKIEEKKVKKMSDEAM